MNNDGSGNNDKKSASSSSSKNLLSKEVQGALKERKSEQHLFARFKNVAADALERMSRQEEQDGSQNKFKMGEKESKIIQGLNGVGLMEGAAAGIVTFFVLRRGPIYVGRYVRRRQMAQYQQSQTPPPSKDGYKLSDPNNPFQRASTKQQEFPRSGSFVVRSIWFMFDVTLSLMMAASTSMAFTDTDMIRQQIIDMPLVEGTSLTAEALCDPIVNELQKIQKEDDPTYQRLQQQIKNGNSTPASTYLDNIHKFSENCQRRRYMEKRIRQERGMAPNEVVEIPPPGVPVDGPRLVRNNEDGGQAKVVHGDGSEDEFLADEFSNDGGFGPDMSWAANDTDFSDGGNDRAM